MTIPISATAGIDLAPRAVEARPAFAGRWVRLRAGARFGDPDFGDEPDEWGIRLLDITISLVALLIALPLMLVIALAIKLTDNGPVLFAHKRIGKGGQRFACLKFRSMAVDADAQLKALLARDPAAREEWERSHKLRRDPRITPIGNFLRRSSLDELPQLFNVLRGEMSLVGPRPIVDAEVVRYGHYFRAYCSVRPGVTGLWQVRREHDTSYRHRVALDVTYARTRTVWLNVAILAKTVPSVLMAKGAW